MSREDGRFDLTLKEPPMTIIAAMRETATDSVLIATDSMQTETSGIRSFTNEKLQHHPTAPLAWGTTGNATIGEQFNEWAKSLAWPPKNWNSLKKQICECLSKLNGDQRRLCRMAGVKAELNELTGVLVVAYMNGVWILEVDDRGVPTLVMRDFHAIGTGWPNAHGVHQTLTAIKVNITPEQMLYTIVDLAARSAKECYPPVVLGRVTAKGFERVTLEAP